MKKEVVEYVCTRCKGKGGWVEIPQSRESYSYWEDCPQCEGKGKLIERSYGLPPDAATRYM